MSIFEGTVAVVPSPLNEDESPDLPGTEKLIEFLVSEKVGLFALGSAGEEMNLPFGTRVQIARKIAEVNNGRSGLLMGAGTFGVRDALDFCKEIKDCKIDGIHVISYDSKMSDSGVEKLYSSIADQIPFPLWLYQNSTRSNGISIDAARRLKEHPNIVGCKIAGFHLRTNLDFVALADDNFEVIGSADAQFFAFMCLGLKACTTSSASCFPELFKDLHKAIASNDLQKAREKNKQVLRFLKRVPKGAYKHNGESTAELKYFLSLRGICKEYCAKPWRDLNDEEKSAAREVFKDYQLYLKDGKIRA
ncbi:MAG: dihydrodipicolinate synthase family protein [Phycisphaeraceae bacterium]|nr:dihydrodipicolinate synthase family protein [Phycisphaeraceae bacterium]